MVIAAGEPGCLGVVCRSSASFLPLVETEWVDAGMKVYKRNRPESASCSNHGKKSHHQTMSAEECKEV